MAILNFNAATVKPSDAFEVVPAGWYNVRITESENKPTKDGSGNYLALTLTVIDGQYANRKLFERLNIGNKSQVAKDIAFQTLSAICHAVGVIQLTDSTMLHGIPLQAKVKVKPADGKYQEGNEISGYRAISAGGGAMPVPAFVQQGQPAAPAWATPAAAAPAPAPVPTAVPTPPAAPGAAPTPPWAS